MSAGQAVFTGWMEITDKQYVIGQCIRDITIVLHETPDEITTLVRLTKMTNAEVKAMIEERKESILREASDVGVIEAVASTPGAIGMVEEHSISGRVNVVKVDGKLPLEAGYLPH